MRGLSGALGAVDAVLHEVREEFDGHDPAHPLLRASIERTRAELETLYAMAQPFLGELERPACDMVAFERLQAATRDDRG